MRDDGPGFDVASVDGGMGVEDTRARLGAVYSLIEMGAPAPACLDAFWTASKQQ